MVGYLQKGTDKLDMLVWMFRTSLKDFGVIFMVHVFIIWR